MEWVIQSFLVIHECPYPMMGQVFLSKMTAQIHFSDKGVKLIHQNGEPVWVLVKCDLIKEFRIYQEPTKPEPDIEA